MPAWGYIIIVCLVLLVVLSGFFSGSEIVYAKVNKLRLKKTAKKDKKARLAYKLNENYPALIGTILVGNNLVNIAASSLATVLFTYLYPESGALLATIIMTATILVFGEILPKTILSKYAFSSSKKMARPLYILEIIFFPIVWSVNKVIGLASKLWTPKEKAPTATDEELEVMADEIEEEGYIDEETHDLLRNAIDFVDVMAFEVMKPRVDIYAIDIEDDINELIKEKEFFTYSRIPIYEETIDNIIGVVNTNEVLKLALAKKKIDLKEIMYQPIFVHKTKTLSSVLQDFKKQHIHIAVVIDEFGGTLGIVTLEDILEELVGDIWDETDTVEEEATVAQDGSTIIDGDMNIYDMFELFEMETEEFESEYDTVAGWCTEMLEKFPEVGDSFTYESLKLTIIQVDGVRVEKVKVERIETQDEDE